MQTKQTNTKKKRVKQGRVDSAVVCGKEGYDAMVRCVEGGGEMGKINK